MLTAALILTAGLVAGNDFEPPFPLDTEKIEVPGKGEPEYTDVEAATFAKRLETLEAEVTAGKRKYPTDLKAMPAELKIEAKKMRGGPLHVGNATDWVEYKLSPNYALTAAYNQLAPKETAFRDIRIAKVKPVKPE